MILLRTPKWMVSAVLALVISAVLFVILFGWDWLRASLERQVLALGVINPLLALIPLVDAGPGKDSDCVQWLQGKK
jgi:hypothetical protein